MVDIGENSDAKSDPRRGQSLHQFSPSFKVLAQHQTRSLTNHCTADPANDTITEKIIIIYLAWAHLGSNSLLIISKGDNGQTPRLLFSPFPHHFSTMKRYRALCAVHIKWASFIMYQSLYREFFLQSLNWGDEFWKSWLNSGNEMSLIGHDIKCRLVGLRGGEEVTLH